MASQNRERRSLIELAEERLNQPKAKKRKPQLHAYDPETGRRILKTPYRPKSETSTSKSCRRTEVQGDPLVDMIQQAKALLQEKSSQKRQSKSWEQRVANLQESWGDSRSKIFECVLSDCAVSPSCVCKMCSCESPLIKCRQCGINCLLCGKCDEDVHVHHPLHDREIWWNGFLQPLLPTQGLNSEGNVINIRLQKLVAYRSESGDVLALGYHLPERRILHGRDVPHACDVVQIKHLHVPSIPAPVILGDAEENAWLQVDQYFALPKRQLAVIKIVKK